jgi:hypothetical protein
MKYDTVVVDDDMDALLHERRYILSTLQKPTWYIKGKIFWHIFLYTIHRREKPNEKKRLRGKIL